MGESRSMGNAELGSWNNGRNATEEWEQLLHYSLARRLQPGKMGKLWDEGSSSGWRTTRWAQLTPCRYVRLCQSSRQARPPIQQIVQLNCELLGLFCALFCLLLGTQFVL